MDLFKTIIGGVVVIGVITAIGLRASGLSQVGKTGFQGTAGLIKTAEGQ
jgi:hypothetical protein